MRSWKLLSQADCGIWEPVGTCWDLWEPVATESSTLKKELTRCPGVCMIWKPLALQTWHLHILKELTQCHGVCRIWEPVVALDKELAWRQRVLSEPVVPESRPLDNDLSGASFSAGFGNLWRQSPGRSTKSSLGARVSVGFGNMWRRTSAS